MSLSVVACQQARAALVFKFGLHFRLSGKDIREIYRMRRRDEKRNETEGGTIVVGTSGNRYNKVRFLCSCLAHRQLRWERRREKQKDG